MTRRGWIAVGVVFAAWVLAVAVWAARPQVDRVPAGVVDGKQVFEPVVCNSPLSSSPGPAEPLPELSDGRTYERTACVAMHDEQRKVLGLDLVVVAGAGVVFALAARRAKRSEHDQGPT